ncbi:MAG: agmatinase [Deltaproteobacteria bacterium]|nr:agmatinase [Deltaproteobacteria bacterium]
MINSKTNLEEKLPYPSFLASELGETDPDQALFHVIPVPYEKTVTYGEGTKKGPSAILTASQQLELYDGFGIPGEKGIYTEAPHNCSGSPDTVLDSLAARVKAIVAQKKIPVVLGGEHTVTSGALMGVVSALGPVGVIQFDAHGDLRDRYEGSRHNHACTMRRVLDQGHTLFQMGVRSLSPKEVQYRRDQAIAHLDAVDLNRGGIPERMLPEDFPENIYITIDVDCLDPSIMPSTGTPEPGGVTWYQMIDALKEIVMGKRVVGFDVVELAPIPGFHAPDYAIARLVYQLMGLV